MYVLQNIMKQKVEFELLSPSITLRDYTHTIQASINLQTNVGSERPTVASTT